MRAAAAAALLAALAACSGEEPSPSAPSPTPAATPAPPAAARSLAPGELPAPELDAAPAAGAWRLKASATGAAALFGDPGGDPQFAVRCDPAARMIEFVRAGGAGRSLRIVLPMAAARFDAQPGEGGGAQAGVPATDRFLDALAATAGPIAVVVDDAPPLALPMGEPVATVIASCRRPG